MPECMCIRFCPLIKVAVKADFRRFSGINYVVFTATVLDVDAARAMAGFATVLNSILPFACSFACDAVLKSLTYSSWQSAQAFVPA
jgi:hypothetical protein